MFKFKYFLKLLLLENKKEERKENSTFYIALNTNSFAIL